LATPSLGHAKPAANSWPRAVVVQQQRHRQQHSSSSSTVAMASRSGAMAESGRAMERGQKEQQEGGRAQRLHFMASGEERQGAGRWARGVCAWSPRTSDVSAG